MQQRLAALRSALLIRHHQCMCSATAFYDCIDSCMPWHELECGIKSDFRQWHGINEVEDNDNDDRDLTALWLEPMTLLLVTVETGKGSSPSSCLLFTTIERGIHSHIHDRPFLHYAADGKELSQRLSSSGHVNCCCIRGSVTHRHIHIHIHIHMHIHIHIHFMYV